MRSGNWTRAAVAAFATVPVTVLLTGCVTTQQIAARARLVDARIRASQESLRITWRSPNAEWLGYRWFGLRRARRWSSGAQHIPPAAHRLADRGGCDQPRWSKALPQSLREPRLLRLPYRGNPGSRSTSSWVLTSRYDGSTSTWRPFAEVGVSQLGDWAAAALPPRRGHECAVGTSSSRLPKAIEPGRHQRLGHPAGRASGLRSRGCAPEGYWQPATDRDSPRKPTSQPGCAMTLLGSRALERCMAYYPTHHLPIGAQKLNGPHCRTDHSFHLHEDPRGRMATYDGLRPVRSAGRRPAALLRCLWHATKACLRPSGPVSRRCHQPGPFVSEVLARDTGAGSAHLWTRYRGDAGGDSAGGRGWRDGRRLAGGGDANLLAALRSQKPTVVNVASAGGGAGVGTAAASTSPGSTPVATLSSTFTLTRGYAVELQTLPKAGSTLADVSAAERAASAEGASAVGVIAPATSASPPVLRPAPW